MSTQKKAENDTLALAGGADGGKRVQKGGGRKAVPKQSTLHTHTHTHTHTHAHANAH